MESSKPIHTIVLDAGPLLINQPSISTLLAQAEEIITTPSVLEEIRDPTARNRVETTVKPFLKIRAPGAASLKAVSEFAKKTGDFSVLSRTDLHLFALAHELECERNGGDWRLRSTPGQKRLNGAPPQSETPAGEQDQETSQSTATEATIPSQVVENNAQPDRSLDSEAPTGESRETVDVSEQDVPAADLSNLAREPTPEDQSEPPSAEQSLPDEEGDDADQITLSDEDSDGWITPSNLKKRQQEDAGMNQIDETPQTILQVATLTTDFALQNSLMLMNLNLISPSLARISNLRSHILRCHACFATTKNMDKQFCPRCGGPTLTRVSCSTTPRGGFKLHLKKNMQWNTRGNKFSIPKPVHGTSSGKTGKGGTGKGGKGGWGKELLLTEDQKEYTKAVTDQQKRKEKNLMDEDYLPRILTGERGTAGKVKVGAGRNVNSRKR